jgi:glycosyltransferase involved in cell wall biosynthesis
VYGRQLPLSELPSLYASADAFVLPSRGEGWGRPHAEAMSMGLPVIATNWSGNTAFMNSSNSLPLPVEKLIYRKRGENHMWAEPSVIELQKLMRYCLNQPEEVKHLGKIGRKTMVEEYNPEVVGNIVLKELENIASEMRKKNEL